MTIETDLKSLVEVYAQYSPETKSYSGEQLDAEKRLMLGKAFTQLLVKKLLMNGPEKAHLKGNYKKLLPYFEIKPDTTLSPEVQWIEQALSQGKNDGACLRYLNERYDRAAHPEKYRDIKFDEIRNRADLIRWLETAKKKSRTDREKNLYDSILNLLKESDSFYDEVGKIELKGIRSLINFLPVALIGLSAATFLEELFAIYAIFFVLLKGTQLLGKSQVNELSTVGKTLHKMSAVTATTTTMLLVRLMELIFWASLQCYSATLKSGAAVLAPLFSLFPTETPATLEEDLLQASKNSEIGMIFSDLHLKLIVSPIEAHHRSLGQQYFRSFRAGETKIIELSRILAAMKKTDEKGLSRELTMELVGDLLLSAQQNKEVYVKGSKTAAAIDKAIAFMHFLTKNPLAMPEKEEAGAKKEQLAVSSPF